MADESFSEALRNRVVQSILSSRRSAELNNSQKAAMASTFAEVGGLLCSLSRETGILVARTSSVDGKGGKPVPLEMVVGEIGVTVLSSSGARLSLGMVPHPESGRPVLMGTYVPGEGSAREAARAEWDLEVTEPDLHTMRVRAGVNWFVDHLGEFILNSQQFIDRDIER